MLPRMLDSGAYERLDENRHAPKVAPRATRVCLECAGPFSRCPVYRSTLVPGSCEDETPTLLATVATCWCLQCEHHAEVAMQASSGETRASALRSTHDAQELERFVFETAAVHGAWLARGYLTREQHGWDEARATDWSSDSVPVLHLRQMLLVAENFNNDQKWLREDEVAHETPRWLKRVRRNVSQVLRKKAHTDGTYLNLDALQAVLAPFNTTLTYVAYGDDAAQLAVRELLDERRDELATRYHLDIPQEVCAEPRKHTVARALFLRLAVAYDLMSIFNGDAWDFNRANVRTPYLKNRALQKLAYNAQLFADTHLDLCVVCELHGARYDDVFMASCFADVGGADNEPAHANPYSHSTAAPVALTMSILQRFYPHPVRAPCGGELSSLGSPLYATNETSSSSSSSSATASSSATSTAASAAAASAAASASSNGNGAQATSGANTMLDAVVRFIYLKPQNYRAMLRSLADIATRHMRDFNAINTFLLSVMWVSQLGNFDDGPRFRPRWRARLAVQRSFQFDEHHFEPDWCPNCGTGGENLVPKNVTGNACPWCVPREKSVWCVNKCMRSELQIAADVEMFNEGDFNEEARGDDERTNPLRKEATSTGWFGGAGEQEAGRLSDSRTSRRMQLDAAFAQLRGVHGQCPLCEKEQARRESDPLGVPLDAAQLLEFHYASQHICDFCTSHPHDDSEEVLRLARASTRRTKKTSTSGLTKEQRDRELMPPPKSAAAADDESDAVEQESWEALADAGNKKLCSLHVCEPCRMLRQNYHYFFHCMKEFLIFRVEKEHITEARFIRNRMWEPYKRIMREGMDEVRSLIDSNFTLSSEPDYVALRPTLQNMWTLINEHVHLSHRCAQQAVSTMYKKSFVKLLLGSMKTYQTSKLLNKLVTRPQRAVDFLKHANLVLECAQSDADRRSARIIKRHEQLRKWRTRGYTSEDVRKVAEMAAEMAMSDTEDRPCPIFFNMLRMVGMTPHGMELVHSACYDREVCRMPDHRLESYYVRRLAEHSVADFYILLYFCEQYLLREPVRIYPLSLDAARAQMAALRRRLGIMPYDYAPADIDVRYVCLCCSKWYAPIVQTVNVDDIPQVIQSGGDAAKLSSKMNAVGAGDLRHNLVTGKLMCSRYHNSMSAKKYDTYGLLDVNLNYDQMDEQADESGTESESESASTAAALGGGGGERKASSIRRIRERRNDCATKPLTGIAMLGIMANMRGSTYALCGYCASMFVVTEAKPMAGGIPNCGCHVMFGEPRAYTNLSAFRSPFMEPVRAGNWLHYGFQTSNDVVTRAIASAEERYADALAEVNSVNEPLAEFLAERDSELAIAAANDANLSAMIASVCTKQVDVLCDDSGMSATQLFESVKDVADTAPQYKLVHEFVKVAPEREEDEELLASIGDISLTKELFQAMKREVRATLVAASGDDVLERLKKTACYEPLARGHSLVRKVAQGANDDGVVERADYEFAVNAQCALAVCLKFEEYDDVDGDDIKWKDGTYFTNAATDEWEQRREDLGLPAEMMKLPERAEFMESVMQNCSLYGFERSDVRRLVSPVQYEYEAPRLGAVLRSAADLAAVMNEGWLRCSPSITYPKGAIEGVAILTIQRVFETFAMTSDSMSGAAPASAPVPNEEELVPALAHNLMEFSHAERRIRRERQAATVAYQRAAEDIGMGGRPKKMDEHRSGVADHANELGGFDNFVPYRTLRLREEIRNEMQMRSGSTSTAILIVCAYCGTVCDKSAQFVRLQVHDVDRLCCNRYTRLYDIRSQGNESALLDIFLCQRHFYSLEPLLCHFPTPTSAMVFVWLRCQTRDILRKEKFKDGGYPEEDRSTAALLKSANSKNELAKGWTKRARMSATPKSGILFYSSNPKRGRPPGSGRGGIRGQRNGPRATPVQTAGRRAGF